MKYEPMGLCLRVRSNSFAFVSRGRGLLLGAEPATNDEMMNIESNRLWNAVWRTVVSKGFFGQKLAGRATLKLGDFIDMLNIVFRFEFRTFDLSDESARNADPAGKHA